MQMQTNYTLFNVFRRDCILANSMIFTMHSFNWDKRDQIVKSHKADRQ